MDFHLNTITDECHGYLEILGRMDFIKRNNFGLVGGTNLSLRYGHRMSDDIDLFANEPFEMQDVINEFVQEFGVLLTILRTSKNSSRVSIGNVKCDLVLNQYLLLKPLEANFLVPLYSVEDVIGMKLNAVCNRGAKKDFYDIYQLLDYYPLENMIDLFLSKYKMYDPITVLMSLQYFDDANTHTGVMGLKNQDWEMIKSRISNEVKSYINKNSRI